MSYKFSTQTERTNQSLHDELIAKAEAMIPVLRDRSNSANSDRRIPEETIQDFSNTPNVFSDLTPSNQEVLSSIEAATVHMTKLRITFQKNTDETLSLSSYIYPINFRFGKKMTYHD